MPRSFAFLAALLLVGPATAQTPGSCALGSAEGTLDVSNVTATVFNTGSIGFGNTTTNGDGYNVPADLSSPLFAANLWVAGTVGGQVRAAGARFSGFTYWPGPLNAGATLPDPTDCSPYDRIYVVSEAELAAYELGEGSTPDLRDWPVGLGAPAVDASGAPVVVTSRGQRLDLAAGERPEIFGSQTAFWVMNDVGNEHVVLDTAPLGLEVRVVAYAIGGRQLRGASESTFYRYTLINRSANTIEDARAGLWLDPDLGNAGDDYIGTDPDRGMLYVYNANETDSAYGPPPAFGVDLLSGAASGRWLAKTNGPNTEPTTGVEMDRVLRGLWLDGTPVRALGHGYGQPESAPVTVWQWPGDPITESFWSEVNTDGDGADSWLGDRRALIVADAFTLSPGASVTVDVAFLFAQGLDRFDSITELRAVSDAVQAVYDLGELADYGGRYTPPPSPRLVGPADGDDARGRLDVEFTWEPVAGATAYALSWGSWSGRSRGHRVVEGTRVTLPVTELSDVAGEHAVTWSVRPLASGTVWPPSEERNVMVFRPGALFLDFAGAPAFLEIQGPGGSDPCSPSAQSRDICHLGYGNLVYSSYSSTGTYYAGVGTMEPHFPAEETTDAVGLLGPNEFEIRYTADGGLGTFVQDGAATVVRVPFEVWDVGPLALGAENDPSDDVRLIPALVAEQGGTCAFDPAETPDGEALIGGFVETDRIGGAYPETTYEAFAGAFEALVAGAADGCYTAASPDEVAAYLTDDLGFQDIVFGTRASAPEHPGEGTVVRLYAVDRVVPVAQGTGPEEAELTVSVAPNPSRGGATVRFTLETAGAFRVRLLDVLGREVARLREGDAQPGTLTARLPSGLSPGVYAVEVVAGDRRASRRLTVVR